jgi:hypothetical protein
MTTRELRALDQQSPSDYVKRLTGVGHRGVVYRVDDTRKAGHMGGYTHVSQKGWLNRAVGKKEPVPQSARALKNKSAKLWCAQCRDLQKVIGQAKSSLLLALACGHVRGQQYTLEG